MSGAVFSGTDFPVVVDNPRPWRALSARDVNRIADRIFDIDPWLEYDYDQHSGAFYVCAFCGQIAVHDHTINKYWSPHKRGCIYGAASRFIEDWREKLSEAFDADA